MKITTKNVVLEEIDINCYRMSLIIPIQNVDKLRKIVDSEKFKVIEIKKKTEKRSLSANNYHWQLINKIAKKINSTDDEVYDRMLRDWGTKEYVAVVPEAIPLLKKAYKIVEIVSKVKVNGKNAVQLRLIRGSSTFDTLEMSKLINGVVEEAKILDIETITPNEIKMMIERYEN